MYKCQKKTYMQHLNTRPNLAKTLELREMRMISGFCCSVNEIFALLTRYTTLTGS